MNELKEMNEQKEQINLGYVSIYFIKPHIVCSDYKTEEIIDVEKGIKILEGTKCLTGDARFALIVNISDFYTPFKEHFKFMVSQRNLKKDKMIARAIVATNMASRIEMQNFISAYKPLTPTKLFSTVEEALTWLEPQISMVNPL
jgi:hypothetical protein